MIAAITPNRCLCLLLPVVLLLVLANTVAAQPDAKALADAVATDVDVPASPPEPVPFNATVTEIDGKHAQLSIDNGQNWQPAAQDAQLAADGMVRTGFATRVTLSFQDETVIKVEPLSCVRIDQAHQTAKTRTVQADLPYGAVRCGVAHGILEADTRIRTPVSTLSVRGTLVYVSYAPGYNHCLLRVDEDGPAIARLISSRSADVWQPFESVIPPTADPNIGYTLHEGMYTNCDMSRHLELVTFDRAVWVNGNIHLGDVTPKEARPKVSTPNAIDKVEPREDTQDTVTEEFDWPGGIIPIGESPDPSNNSSR